MADSITLQGTIRDFSSGKRPDLPESHPDFETDTFNGRIVETGIVGSTLDPISHKPIYVGGFSQKKSTQSASEFARWYANAHPFQKPFSITLTKIGTNPDVYSYENRAFFPIDGELLKNETYADINGIQRNFHFTYELSTEFTYQGGEKFTFTGDDDLWVFIGDKIGDQIVDKLVIDLGGIHVEQSATILLDDLTWVKYNPVTGAPVDPPEKIKLEVGKTYSLRLFFAERHTVESHFRIDTSIVLSQPVATIVASDPSANELGPDTGAFTISLDKPALTDLTLTYSVAGTAVEGTDYSLSTGKSVLLRKGETSAQITVTPNADQLTEGPETVIATLIGGSGYQTGTPSSATVTIADNPPPPPVATIMATDPTASESGLDPGQFAIMLDKPAIADLTIGYTVGGTATQGGDYQSIGSSVVIAKGATIAFIPVSPIVDQLTEGPETVVVTLQPGSGYQLSPTISATVTIADNPPPPPPVIPVVTLFASDPIATKPRSGQATDMGAFTIELKPPAPTELEFSLSVSGSARADQDCKKMPSSVKIAAGAPQVTFLVEPMAQTAARTGAGVTHVTVKLAPHSSCQFGNKIEDTVTINVPGTGPVVGP